MDLHEKNYQKNIAVFFSPLFSKLIILFGAYNFIRKIIALLNFYIGRGSGTGWKIKSEVLIATKLIKNKNPTVFDVGGNVGTWSQTFRNIKKSGELYIFEPLHSCQKIIESLNIPNCKLIKNAIGIKKSEMKLYFKSPTDGSASLHKRDDSFFKKYKYKQDLVKVINLDSFISENKISFVDFIKFDIEGNELDALKGLEKSISNDKIGAFSFEFGSGNINSRTYFRDFWTLLNEKYNIYIILPSDELKQIENYYEDLEFYRGVTNFIAVLK